MQYGQNISLPYPQQQTDHNNMFGNDHKDNILKAKMERDEGKDTCTSTRCWVESDTGSLTGVPHQDSACHSLRPTTISPTAKIWHNNLHYILLFQQSISKFCRMSINHGKHWPIQAIPLTIHRTCYRRHCPYRFSTFSSTPKRLRKNHRWTRQWIATIWAAWTAAAVSIWKAICWIWKMVSARI